MGNWSKLVMIDYLRSNFSTWREVFMHYNEVQYFTPVHGWYVCFDGPSLSEMYLENEDPRSDLSGEIITERDVFYGR